MFACLYRTSVRIRLSDPARWVSLGQTSDKLRIQSSGPPENQSRDWIGPPDTESNLRLKRFFCPKDETELEQRLRRQNEDTQKWNQKFWAEHNTNFIKQKENFIQQRLKQLGPTTEDGKPRKLTAEDLSSFYQKFLNDNYSLHSDYNREWYKRNISLLWPALKVNIQRWFMRR